jgi:predicted nucleotidyltransferase
MDAQTVVSRLRPARERLFSDFRIRSLALFGSVARNEASESSDVDLVVELEEPLGLRFVDLADTLEALIGAPVDLVSRGGIKERYWTCIREDLVYV